MTDRCGDLQPAQPDANVNAHSKAVCNDIQRGFRGLNVASLPVATCRQNLLVF